MSEEEGMAGMGFRAAFGFTYIHLGLWNIFFWMVEEI